MLQAAMAESLIQKVTSGHSVSEFLILAKVLIKVYQKKCHFSLLKNQMVLPSYMTQCFEFKFPFTYKVLAAESPNSARKIFVCYFKVHKTTVF